MSMRYIPSRNNVVLRNTDGPFDFVYGFDRPMDWYYLVVTCHETGNFIFSHASYRVEVDEILWSNLNLRHPESFHPREIVRVCRLFGFQLGGDDTCYMMDNVIRPSYDSPALVHAIKLILGDHFDTSRSETLNNGYSKFAKRIGLNNLKTFKFFIPNHKRASITNYNSMSNQVYTL